MAKRPKIKQADGTLVDLPLDAETLQGKGLSELALKTDLDIKQDVVTIATSPSTKVKDIYNGIAEKLGSATNGTVLLKTTGYTQSLGLIKFSYIGSNVKHPCEYINLQTLKKKSYTIEDTTTVNWSTFLNETSYPSTIEYATSGDVTDAIDNFKADEFEPAITSLRDDIPTKTSQLTNDSKYATTDQLFSKNYNDLTNKPSIPTKTSELTNDSHFITNAVNNLTNYYLKSETYTKSEVQQLLSTISSLKLEVVTNLPTTDISSNTIYLKPLDSAKENNIYTEYIYVNNKWETIGTTAVDLSNYALISDIPTKTSQLTNDSNFLTKQQDISGKLDKEEFDTLKNELDNGDFVVSTASFAEADNAGNRIIDTYATKTEIPTKTSELTNDSSYTTQEDLDVKQDKLVSGENIKTIDGKSLLGNGDITTYNLIYGNAGPTDTVQNVITQIKKYLSIDGNEGYYGYVGHIRYTGYKEYLNGYINLQVTNGGTHIAIRYNDILNQKHCSIEGDYAGIANMSINNFLDAYLVPNSPTKTSELENDSGFLSEIPSDVVTKDEQGAIKLEDDYGYVVISPSYIDMYCGGSNVYIGAEDGAMFDGVSATYIKSESMYIYDTLEVDGDLYAEESTIYAWSIESTIYKDSSGNRIEFDNLISGIHLVSKGSSLALASSDMFYDNDSIHELTFPDTSKDGSYDGYQWDLPAKSGTIALTSDIPTLKTVNGQSLIGSGNIVIEGGGSGTPPKANNGYEGFLYAGGDGVTEMGKYIDFHATSTDTKDYDVRFVCPSLNSQVEVHLPSKAGTIALTNDIPPIDNASGVQDIGWTDADMNAPRIATANRIAHWNGAYNNTNASNLTYCARGTIAGLGDVPANISTTSMYPSECTYNGFFYVTSYVNSLSGADANPFIQYHGSNGDFRILTTAYNDQWLQQIATDFRSPYVYTRRRENGSWSSWTRLIDDNSIPFSYTFVLSNDSVPHYISTAGVKQLYFTMMSNDNDEDTLYFRTSNNTIMGMPLKMNQMVDVIVDVAGGNYSMRNITTGSYSGGSYSNDGYIGLFVSSTSGSSTTIFAVRGYRN